MLAASPPSLIKGWVSPADMFCLIGLCLRCFILCSLRKNPPETCASPGNHLIYNSATFLPLIKCLVIELFSCKVLSPWQQLQWLAGCTFSDIDSRRHEQTHGASPAKRRKVEISKVPGSRERRERGPGPCPVLMHVRVASAAEQGRWVPDSVPGRNKDSLLRGSLP